MSLSLQVLAKLNAAKSCSRLPLHSVLEVIPPIQYVVGLCFMRQFNIYISASNIIFLLCLRANLIISDLNAKSGSSTNHHIPRTFPMDLDKALSDEFIIPSNRDIGARAISEENGRRLLKQ